jgi:hypothetical protein
LLTIQTSLPAATTLWHTAVKTSMSFWWKTIGMRNAEYMTTRKVRSGPIYVETERGTFSLVFEAKVREVGGSAAQPVGKPDVYVINGDGVRLVRHSNRFLRATLVGVAAYVVLWTISRALHRNY